MKFILGIVVTVSVLWLSFVYGQLQAERDIQTIVYSYLLYWHGMASSPEWHDCGVCDVVVKYLDYPPYLQFFTDPPNLEVDDIEELLELLKRGYVESDFPSSN